jgi:hypothetical protein
MSVFVVRAFVKMREVLAQDGRLAEKLAELERRLTGRLDVHEKAIVHILEEIKKLMEPLPPQPEPKRRQIGFHVHDDAAAKTSQQPRSRGSNHEEKMLKRISQAPAKSLAEKAEMALRKAVAGVIREHRRLGEPLAISRGGKVVMVPADELVLPEEQLECRTKRR